MKGRESKRDEHRSRSSNGGGRGGNGGGAAGVGSGSKTASSPDRLFQKLDRELQETVEEQYFLPPREFKSLVEVLAVVGERIDQFVEEASRGGGGGGGTDDGLINALKEQNPAYNNLLYQKEVVDSVIEDVVTFQNGGLNASLETMTEVIKEYTKSKEDISALRAALQVRRR